MKKLIVSTPVETPTQPGDYAEMLGSAANRAAAQSTLEDYRAGKSPETLRRQRADIQRFETYLNEAGQGLVTFSDMAVDLARWSSITYGLVKEFIKWQLSQGYAIGSVNVRLATIKTYCGLAASAGYLSGDTLALVQTAKGIRGQEGRNHDEKREQTRRGNKKAQWLVLSSEQLTRLIHDHEDTATGRRDKLLMCLLVEKGLRCGEVARLNVEDFDLQAGSFTVDRRKVNKEQAFRLEQNTRLATLAYLTQGPKEGPLFRSKLNGEDRKAEKQRIDVSTINARVQAIGKRILGIDNLSPHDLRHNIILALFKQGNTIDRIQAFGGWSNPYMPMKYAEHASYANEGVTIPQY